MVIIGKNIKRKLAKRFKILKDILVIIDMRKYLLPLLSLLLFISIANAQVRNRWQLIFHNQKPTLFKYRDALGKVTNYWYVVFDITNPTEEAIPILVDLALYTEPGKDLMSDIEKVELGKASSGRYYPNVIKPEVEERVITKAASIGDRPEGLVKEAIEELKKANQFLNIRELREKKYVKSGEVFHSIAIFPEIDPKSRTIELQVSGLVDLLKIETAGNEAKMNYENRIYRIIYDYVGDEFHRDDALVIFSDKNLKSEKWIIKNMGPIALKDTLESLLNILLQALKEEKDGATYKSASPFDLKVANDILESSLGKKFGFDQSKSPLENEQAIWRWQEWWIKNKGKLYYDDKVNRFMIK